MTYLLLKFIHIISVIIWIGGASIMSLLNYVLIKKQDTTGFFLLSKYQELIGKSVMGASAMLTLITGILLSMFFGFGWPLWVILGLLVIVTTSILGSTVMRKIGEDIKKISNSDNIDQQILHSYQNKLLRLNTIFLILLFSTVFLMVFKPDF